MSAPQKSPECPITGSIESDANSVGSEESPASLTETNGGESIKGDEVTKTSILPVQPPVAGTLTAVLNPETIVKYAREFIVECFQNQYGKAYAWILVSDGKTTHYECHPIRSKAFLAAMLNVLSLHTSLMPKLSILKQCIEVMELEAFRSPKRTLENRRTVVKGEVLIDMCNDQWELARITRTGWIIEPQTEPLFIRRPHMLSLPDPIPGGDIHEIFDFFPVEDENEKVLVVVWLLAALYASIQCPIMILVGDKGSAKSTRTRYLRSLVDPSVTAALGKRVSSNLHLNIYNNAVVCFENVSGLKKEEADVMCRAVTGDSVESRQLYTDSDTVLYSFRRPIIINGINSPSVESDFLDRSLTFNCQRLQSFRTLEDLDRQFEAARPRILGAMLDLFVRTLNLLPSTPAATKFRMADFARFGRAVAMAMGKEHKDFDDAYELKQQQQNYEILEDAPMAKLIEKLAVTSSKKKEGCWEGTATELLAALKYVAHVSSAADGRNDLPKTPGKLSTRLGELATALANRNVVIKRLPRTNTSRPWKISLTTPSIEDPNAEPEDIFEAMENAEQ